MLDAEKTECALSTEPSLLLFQLLELLDPELTPSKCKIHLAGHNGFEDPLDVYLAGRFDDWQAEQSNRNFELDHVVSLIQLPEKDSWLFVGVYRSTGWEKIEGPRLYRYDLTPHDTLRFLAGRLIVRFKRSGRQSYLRAENWVDRLHVAAIRAAKLQIAEFPGYSWAMLTKQELDIVVEQQVASWRAALSSVGGVYVIADRKTGKLYVGSATGSEGIWGRWSAYAASGHGGNRDLMQLLRDHGPEYAEHFQFGILETADSNASAEDTIRREQHWKQVLLSRTHGNNAN